MLAVGLVTALQIGRNVAASSHCMKNVLCNLCAKILSVFASKREEKCDVTWMTTMESLSKDDSENNKKGTKAIDLY